MFSILAECEGTVNFLDDVVIHGRDMEEHDQRLNNVLARFAKHNPTLNRERCIFAASAVDFLGHKIAAAGVETKRDNVEAIRKLDAPENTKQLASFLGTTNFYRKFVPQYAVISEPLQKLLPNDTPFESSNRQQHAFDTLKSKIISPPVLAHFDHNVETFVTTDASGIAVGAVLSQLIDGEERPVAFASHALSSTERKYSTGERQALACVYACEHWQTYLYGRRFTLRTDHQTLTTLLMHNRVRTSATTHLPLV